MAIVSRKEVKLLINLCTDVEKADGIIEKYYGFETVREKSCILKRYV